MPSRTGSFLSTAFTMGLAAIVLHRRSRPNLNKHQQQISARLPFTPPGQ
jgi:hypothetical protein